MRIRFIAAAVPLLLAGTLTATAPSVSQAVGGDDPSRPTAPKAQAAQQLATITPCKGTWQKRAFSGGSNDWVFTDSSVTVPGTVYNFKGPKSKKDTLFVTVTATETYVTPGDSGRVRVLLDGIELDPGATGGDYFYPGTNYGSFAGQYCAKVGRGWHRLELVLESNGTDDTAYLWHPMLHAEIAE